MYTNPASIVAGLTLFTPSELIVLHGEQFAGKGGWLDGVRLPHGGPRVAGAPLGERLLAAALLANEQVGSVQLAVWTPERRPWDVILCALSGEVWVTWPAASLEAQVYAGVQSGPLAVSELVYTILGADHDNPWQQVLCAATRGLLARRLVEAAPVHYLLFTVERLQVPARTAIRLAAQSLDGVTRLLAACEQARPDLWRLLCREIHAGVDRRRPSARHDALPASIPPHLGAGTWPQVRR
jgi:hypothetical protein